MNNYTVVFSDPYYEEQTFPNYDSAVKFAKHMLKEYSISSKIYTPYICWDSDYLENDPGHSNTFFEMRNKIS